MRTLFFAAAGGQVVLSRTTEKMRSGYARISKADGSQVLDLQPDA